MRAVPLVVVVAVLVGSAAGTNPYTRLYAYLAAQHAKAVEEHGDGAHVTAMGSITGAALGALRNAEEMGDWRDALAPSGAAPHHHSHHHSHRHHRHHDGLVSSNHTEWLKGLEEEADDSFSTLFIRSSSNPNPFTVKKVLAKSTTTQLKVEVELGVVADPLHAEISKEQGDGTARHVVNEVVDVQLYPGTVTLEVTVHPDSHADFPNFEIELKGLSIRELRYQAEHVLTKHFRATKAYPKPDNVYLSVYGVTGVELKLSKGTTLGSAMFRGSVGQFALSLSLESTDDLDPVQLACPNDPNGHTIDVEFSPMHVKFMSYQLCKAVVPLLDKPFSSRKFTKALAVSGFEMVRSARRPDRSRSSVYSLSLSPDRAADQFTLQREKALDMDVGSSVKVLPLANLQTSPPTHSLGDFGLLSGALENLLLVCDALYIPNGLHQEITNALKIVQAESGVEEKVALTRRTEDAGGLGVRVLTSPSARPFIVNGEIQIPSHSTYTETHDNGATLFRRVRVGAKVTAAPQRAGHVVLPVTYDGLAHVATSEFSTTDLLVLKLEILGGKNSDFVDTVTISLHPFRLSTSFDISTSVASVDVTVPHGVVVHPLEPSKGRAHEGTVKTRHVVTLSGDTKRHSLSLDFSAKDETLITGTVVLPSQFKVVVSREDHTAVQIKPAVSVELDRWSSLHPRMSLSLPNTISVARSLSNRVTHVLLLNAQNLLTTKLEMDQTGTAVYRVTKPRVLIKSESIADEVEEAETGDDNWFDAFTTWVGDLVSTKDEEAPLVEEKEVVMGDTSLRLRLVDFEELRYTLSVLGPLTINDYSTTAAKGDGFIRGRGKVSAERTAAAERTVIENTDPAKPFVIEGNVLFDNNFLDLVLDNEHSRISIPSARTTVDVQGLAVIVNLDLKQFEYRVLFPGPATRVVVEHPDVTVRLSMEHGTKISMRRNPDTGERLSLVEFGVVTVHAETTFLSYTLTSPGQMVLRNGDVAECERTTPDFHLTGRFVGLVERLVTWLLRGKVPEFADGFNLPRLMCSLLHQGEMFILPDLDAEDNLE